MQVKSLRYPPTAPHIYCQFEFAISTANQFAHHIAQDITKSNRDIVCISTIEKVSNNRVFKSNHDQSN
jgi:hypothetical protein